MNYDKVKLLALKTKSMIFSYDHMSFDMKGDADFVTKIDIEISEFFKRELAHMYPEISFFSEEEEGSLKNNCWILDPIDGTTNFIYGYNMSVVSLAHYRNGEVVFGLVYNPFTDELYTAEKGKGAFLGTRQIKTSNRSIKQAIIEFGAGSTHKENADENFKLACEVFKDCIDIRRICCTALALCYIADGRIDGYFEKIIKPWDIAAGSIILSEAGGMMSDFSGKSIDFSGTTSIIAGNTNVHSYLKKAVE